MNQHRITSILLLCISISLVGCGGGGSGDGAGNNSNLDSDGDGVVNSIDVDDDNNGLIEIATLNDLDLMRNDLGGTSLDGDSTGCPPSGCHGYELVADLNFDTNGNGNLDTGDSYYNGGQGWVPIGTSVTPFMADFNGNGHAIHNLFIKNFQQDYIGLFGYVDGVGKSKTISNLVLDGPLMKVDGQAHVGALAGYAKDVNIEYCSTAGSVQSGGSSPLHAGGLVGDVFNNSITYSYSSSTVIGADKTGGLIGSAMSGTIIKSAYASGYISGNNDTGGLVGFLDGSQIVDSHATGTVSSSGVRVGGLLGSANTGSSTATSIIGQSFSTSSVNGNGYVGGLIGISYTSQITNTFATGNATSSSGSYIGGLIGDANLSTDLSRSYAVGSATSGSGSNIGALVGWSDGATYHVNYFRNDHTTGANVAIGHVNSGSVNSSDASGATLTQLQCPTVASDTSCSGLILYDAWGSVWNFGSDTQLPGLTIDGHVYRAGFILTPTHLSLPSNSFNIGPYPVQSVLIGNGIYFGNYSNTNNAQFFVRYNIPSNNFSAPLQVSSNLCGCGYMSKLVSDGVNIFYIANDATKYTVSGNTWTTLNYPTSAQDNAGEAGVTYYNGNIYFLGGRTASNLFKYYNISQDNWFTAPNYLYATKSSELVALNNLIYAIGGDSASNKMAYFSTMNSTWAALKDIPFTVSVSSETKRTAFIGNYIFLLQGNSIYVYDSANDEWNNTGVTISGLPNYATLLSDGKDLYIAGSVYSTYPDSYPDVIKVTVSFY